jgi:chromosome segregation ATPase
MSEDLTKKLPQTDSEKLNVILTTVQSLEKRIDRLEQEADERRYDTRPLWEKLVADIADLKESLHSEIGGIKSEIGGIKSEIGGIKSDIGEIKRSLRDLSRKQTVLNDSILQIHSDLRDMDARLLALEGTHNQQNSST